MTRVVEEGSTPPRRPPLVPWPNRDLWPWLLVLLVLVIGGIVAAVLLTRDHKKKEASPPTTVVVTTVASTAVTTAPSPTTTRKVPATPRVKVANLLGIPATTAVKRLTEDGLQSAIKSVYSTKPRGIVVAQKPGAGTRVAKGSTITLNISKGQPAKAVPDVVGQSGTQAVGLLRAAGFGASVVQVPSKEPRGTVVAQSPKAGEKAPQGSNVRLNVSNGSPGGAVTTRPATTSATTTTTRTTPAATPTKVPDVVGKKLKQARMAIRNAGLVTEVKYVPNNLPESTVVSQSPKPGTAAKRRDHVLVNVSLGPQPQPQVAVPNVVGQDEATAQTQIQNAGFSVVVEDTPTTDPSQDGIVVDEQPAPGTKAPRGSEIIIYVGRASSG